MTSPQYAPVAVSSSQRERVAHILSMAFANDRISLEQLDERLGMVYRAQSQAELEMLLADPSDASRSLAWEAEGAARIASPQIVADRGVLWGVMGGFERKGPWIVPRHLKITAIMGGGELDLREAKLGPGVTEIEIFALWGGVEIIIPDGVRVELVGMAFMGGLSVSGGDISEDPNAPVLRISGLVVMGGADVRKKNRTKKSEKRYLQALERAEQVRRLTGER
ncbi:MAG: DUF1707 domain-containing protein [Gemmatimonadetes bacterium]|nr:DUF1707 domain-containing protein [Gemmatimonadota bacterium]